MNKHTLSIRRPALMIGIAVLALAFFVAASPSSVRAATLPTRVDADAGWVGTGLVLTSGDVINLAAHGRAITGPLKDFPLAKSGPAGQIWNDPCGVFLPAGPCSLDGAFYGVLIGKIGASGTPFVIGDATSFTAPASGELFLAVNDNTAFYSDNNGGFIVLIK